MPRIRASSSAFMWLGEKEEKWCQVRAAPSHSFTQKALCILIYQDKSPASFHSKNSFNTMSPNNCNIDQYKPTQIRQVHQNAYKISVNLVYCGFL